MSPADPSQPLFNSRNYLIGVVALVVVGAGYAVLASGAASVASVLLVLGYVVLMPLALLA